MLQTHGVSDFSGEGLGILRLRTGMPLYLQPPPAARRSRFHLARLRGAAEDPSRWQRWVPRSPGGGGGLAPRRASRARRCPAPPQPAHRATRPTAPLQSSSPEPAPTSQSAHWPHAGRVTPVPGQSCGLPMQSRPTTPADCQPIKGASLAGAAQRPSRLSQ